MSATNDRTARGVLGTLALAGVAALGLAAAAGPAVAGASGDRFSITVSYAGIDHSQREGATVLYERISAAARTVCARARSNSPLSNPTLMSCRERVIADAIDEMDCDTMRAIHRERYPYASFR